MSWYLAVVRKYAVFAGRARRSEYWYFCLFNVLISLALGTIDGLSGLFHADAGLGVLGGLYGLAVLVPGIAVSVRRLHDTDRSGWWLLLGLVPVVGAIVLLLFTVQEGNSGANRFGGNPRTATA